MSWAPNVQWTVPAHVCERGKSYWQFDNADLPLELRSLRTKTYAKINEWKLPYGSDPSNGYTSNSWVFDTEAGDPDTNGTMRAGDLVFLTIQGAVNKGAYPPLSVSSPAVPVIAGQCDTGFPGADNAPPAAAQSPSSQPEPQSQSSQSAAPTSSSPPLSSSSEQSPPSSGTDSSSATLANPSSLSSAGTSTSSTPVSSLNYNGTTLNIVPTLPSSKSVTTGSTTGTARPSDSNVASHSDSQAASLSTGAIAGIVVGAVVGLILVALLILLCIGRRRSRDEDFEPADENGDENGLLSPSWPSYQVTPFIPAGAKSHQQGEKSGRTSPDSPNLSQTSHTAISDPQKDLPSSSSSFRPEREPERPTPRRGLRHDVDAGRLSVLEPPDYGGEAPS